MSEDLIEEVAAPAAAPPPETGGEQTFDDGVWKRDKQGRQYISAVGRKGIIYRRGEETAAEALERDQRPKDKIPKAKKAKKPGPIPDKPKDVDLRALEETLVNAFRSPAMAAALFGDEWLANHFTVQAPALARNLVVASEHNPWLRRRLETMAAGGDAAMTFVSLIGLAGSFAAYIAPPIVYLLDLPVPGQVRGMFGIPQRQPRVFEMPAGEPAGEEMPAYAAPGPEAAAA